MKANNWTMQLSLTIENMTRKCSRKQNIAFTD